MVERSGYSRVWCPFLSNGIVYHFFIFITCGRVHGRFLSKNCEHKKHVHRI